MTIQKSLLKYFLLIVLLRLSSTALAQFSLTTNSDGTIGISSYNGADGVVIIPNTINGKEVTAIGTGAFASDGSLTNIAIPDSVNTIGINSFSFCTNAFTNALPMPELPPVIRITLLLILMVH